MYLQMMKKNIRRPVSFEEAKHLLDCVDKIEVLSVKMKSSGNRSIKIVFRILNRRTG